MAIEEKEKQETLLNELIEKIEKDPLPTNIFTTEDTDPLVLLGKLNEVIAHLKELRALYFESDSKASEALTKAIDSLEKAQQAITIATTLGNEAINTANSANDTAGEALMEATDAKADAQQAITTATTLGNEAKAQAQQAITTATTLGNEAKADAQQAITTATTLGNEAKAQAQQAIATANEALTQVVQGLGTKVYDNHGNLLTEAKFTGHNGINVDMDETDPETFNIRLDNELVGQLEEMQSKIASNEANITAHTNQITTLSSQLEMTDGLIESIESEINNSIKPRLTSVESTASANASDLEGVHNLINTLNNSVDNLNNITPAVRPLNNYDINTLYDAGIYQISNGSNCPSGTQYGSLLVLTYRKAKGNEIPDYAVQIFLPNGDDTKKTTLYWRTSKNTTWDNWHTALSIEYTGVFTSPSGTWEDTSTIELGGGYELSFGTHKTGTVTFYKPFTYKPLMFGCSINREKGTAGGFNYCSSVTNTNMYIQVGTEWGYWWAFGY